jgi:hypothetical protein
MRRRIGRLCAPGGPGRARGTSYYQCRPPEEEEPLPPELLLLDDEP